jgi:hypothetical protein
MILSFLDYPDERVFATRRIVRCPGALRNTTLRVTSGRVPCDTLEEAIRLILAALDIGSVRVIVRCARPQYLIPGHPAGPPPSLPKSCPLSASGL